MQRYLVSAGMKEAEQVQVFEGPLWISPESGRFGVLLCERHGGGERQLWVGGTGNCEISSSRQEVDYGEDWISGDDRRLAV